MKEQKFPIYSFSFKWSENGIHDEKYPWWHEGLPAGRIWNSTSFTKMYKEEKSADEINQIALDWWDKYTTKYADKKHSDLTFTAAYKEHEAWHLTWFQHETYDIGQTDEEVLLSFEEFVSRKEAVNRQSDKDVYCLMGAEDRWRWHGAEPDGKPSDYSPAPCRCKYCKEQGLIKIAH